jgi:GNAT superfamily N-acetyltransferase
MQLRFQECSPNDPEAEPLLRALSAELLLITGNDGTQSFADDDVRVERSVFIVAMDGEEPVGCGALRPLTNEVCEVKRMYAKYAGHGIGSGLLRALEQHAETMGYREIWLETRRINEGAVRFYLRRGYRVRPNYGKYVGRSEAICLEKAIAPTADHA